MLVAKRIALLLLAFNLANAAPEVALAQENLQKKSFSIKALPINEALHEFSKQSGVQVMFLSESDEQFYSQEITGSYTFYEAMQQMLEGTVLKVQYVNEKIIRIDGPKENRLGRQKKKPAARKIYLQEAPNKIGYFSDVSPTRVAAASSDERASVGPASAEGNENSRGVSSSTPEILVLGSKLLNMDIRRSKDDPQPYVVFDKEVIERSGASDVEEFFRKKMTASSDGFTELQGPNNGRGGTSIDLRGLGSNQTLILVDGRRVASSTAHSGGQRQSDISGIPLAAIERIEILPTTASGIYGGSATGGVINVVLKRDYSGSEARMSYESPVEGSGFIRKVDWSWGGGGEKTNFLISGGYRESAALLSRNRPFLHRARAMVSLNSPSFYESSYFPPLGSTTNIRSVSGENLSINGEDIGAAYTYVPLGYGGVLTDGGGGFFENAGSYNLDSTLTGQVDGGGGVSFSERFGS